MIANVIVNILLFAYIVYLTISHRIERERLYDRIMSGSYKEYKSLGGEMAMKSRNPLKESIKRAYSEKE